MRKQWQNLLALGGVAAFISGSLWFVVQAEPIKAYVNYGDMVPQDLFGAWKRIRHIEKASTGNIEGTDEEGHWVIFREGSKIMLQNPDTGGSSEVQVEKVFDGTAVFNHRTERANSGWCNEQLTLTPENKGNALSGFQVIECFRPSSDKKTAISYYQAFARITGVRDQSLPPIR
jgi:hypothetical protein